MVAFLGAGDDLYAGGPGRDFVSGGSNRDEIDTGDGDDVVWGSGYVVGERVDCGGQAERGDLFVSAVTSPEGIGGCETVESGGDNGDPMLVDSVAMLEAEANDPENANRSLLVWPGEYVLADRLAIPDQLLPIFQR